eukprot:COSAG02_NODE_997_length_15333_cov_13.688526_7_plen_87_part_00
MVSQTRCRRLPLGRRRLRIVLTHPYRSVPGACARPARARADRSLHMMHTSGAVGALGAALTVACGPRAKDLHQNWNRFPYSRDPYT